MAGAVRYQEWFELGEVDKAIQRRYEPSLGMHKTISNLRSLECCPPKAKAVGSNPIGSASFQAISKNLRIACYRAVTSTDDQ